MKAFFDTNVLVCALEPEASARQAQAQALMQQHVRDHTMVLSTQVMLELYNALTRKRRVNEATALSALRLLATRDVVGATADFVVRAMSLGAQHQLANWDAAIVQAAIDSGCDVLFSEDLQIGRRFGTLEVVNPFAPGAPEIGPAPYSATPPLRKLKRPSARR